MFPFIKNKKVRLFTHNDLDGYANYIILRNYFKKEDIYVEYCTPDNIDERIEHFMYSINTKVDYVFITDVAMRREEVAEKLEICNVLFDDIIVKLEDHHKASTYLNKYSFANVEIERNGELICGSMLFYKYLTNHLHFPKIKILEKWLKLVNDYDTWLWEDKYHYDLPKYWNELFFLYERNMFVDNVLYKIKKGNIDFDKTDKILLEIEHGKQDKYIKTRVKNAILKEIQGHKCVITFGEQYINELSTELYKAYPNSEIQIVITGKNISYRVRNKNLNIDLNAFTQKYGGGGHEFAAGSSISEEVRNKYLNLLFN